MSILVLGAGGVAGHVVTAYLREKGYTVDTLAARNPFDARTYLLDVRDTAALTAFLKTRRYSHVINCIGLLVKPSQEQKHTAVYLNAYLPQFLANYYKDRPTGIIHIGSDAVFSGAHNPYAEYDPYDGQTFYGRTKALGDIDNTKDLTIRTSIIGPSLQADNVSLFNWFMAQHGEIRGFTKALWKGVTTLELAKGIDAAITQRLSGIYHFVPEESISKFELLSLCKELFERQNVTLTPVHEATINAALQNTRKDFDYQLPDYRTMLFDMKQWMNSQKERYPHYAQA